ncbi:phosphate-selective porin OprO/OprP [Sinobacterium caligoides]|uniref:Phosphate-selective porin OprO/OprP n=1 Tax=Sinobacterium caligoides TaxID=933926 RepID=A0A3N2DQE5_9GAMM|nr:porin [Sinobacterium caligoides]ROS02064.1 phosphate-selective porin OprO/OprP [Sinobacterium caligoides]
MKQPLFATTILLLAINEATAGTVSSAGDDLIINTKGNLSVKTADNSKSFAIGGRLQWDYDATESKDNEKKTDDFDVRRARIYVKGHVNDWGYKAQFNVAESDGAKGGSAEDLYINYSGFGSAANIKVGKQSEPFGLESTTSSKDISALERSALTEFYAPSRAAGVQLHGKGSNWTYGVGLFESDGDGSNDVEHTALTGRVTFAALHTEQALLHVGASFSSRDAEESADEVDSYGLEFGAAFGPLHLQSEYFASEIGSQDYDGYYLQAGWIITGESRPYKNGVFSRVKPKGPLGAWELVARYEDGDGKYSDIGLESEQRYNGKQYTVGLNYYATKNTRLGLSYMDGEADNAESGGTRFAGNELRGRFQFAF